MLECRRRSARNPSFWSVVQLPSRRSGSIRRPTRWDGRNPLASRSHAPGSSTDCTLGIYGQSQMTGIRPRQLRILLISSCLCCLGGDSIGQRPLICAPALVSARGRGGATPRVWGLVLPSWRSDFRLFSSAPAFLQRGRERNAVSEPTQSPNGQRCRHDPSVYHAVPIRRKQKPGASRLAARTKSRQGRTSNWPPTKERRRWAPRREAAEGGCTISIADPTYEAVGRTDELGTDRSPVRKSGIGLALWS